uniref:G_PROTEIN_RECEP_F1_2 domain-containing protein n=1 Tax=Brugia timori TaxID=42155 RepID=A0A0R3QLS0_9BILA
LKFQYKTLTAACFACVIVISTNIFIIQKFIKHLPTAVLAILEIVLVLSILLALILAAILKRRDLLSVYMVSAFIYSQYRVIIAVTAVLIAIFPQTYLLALSSQQYSRSQGPLCCENILFAVQIVWISVCFASILVWTVQMLSVYLAITYRSYLPRSKRQKRASEAVPKKKQSESVMASNVVEQHLQPVLDHQLKPLSKRESQPVSKENLQQVPEGGSLQPLFAKNQQPVSFLSTDGRTKDQAKEQH